MDKGIIEVYADWELLKKTQLMGSLRVERLRGKEVFSFEYADSWLENKEYFSLDPDLYFFKGPQFLRDDKVNFGLFLDSSPDRWGRLLMQRREALIARKEKRAVRVLGEKDFLLGVYDESRMGALRFKYQGSNVFENADKAMASPPWAMLRDLEYASHVVESDKEIKDLDSWLALLIAPGSSLGGARPKANIVDERGNIWIAKFPSKNDFFDSASWEMLVAMLAREAGLNMSEVKLERFSNRGHTFLTRRFDRHGIKRIHFASAMTLLGKKDGESAETGASYLELAEFIMQNSASPEQDLKELWSRIVFSVITGNTDDHLRNHGFLLSKKGWRLSPCYDINPNPRPLGLSLAIDEYDNSMNLDLVLSTAPYYRLSQFEAESIIEGIKKTVSTWRVKARTIDISKREIEKMSGAFLL